MYKLQNGREDTPVDEIVRQRVEVVVARLFIVWVILTRNSFKMKMVPEKQDKWYVYVCNQFHSPVSRYRGSRRINEDISTLFFVPVQLIPLAPRFRLVVSQSSWWWCDVGDSRRLR